MNTNKKTFTICCGLCNEEFVYKTSLYHHFDIVHNISQEFRLNSDFKMTTKPMKTVSKKDHVKEIKGNEQLADLLEPLNLVLPTTYASQSTPKSTNFPQGPSTTVATPQFDPPPHQSKCNESIRNLMSNVTKPLEAKSKRANDDKLGFSTVAPLIYATQSINSCVPESTTNIAQSASTEFAMSEIKVEKQSGTNKPLTVPSTSDSQSISSSVSESTNNIAQPVATEIAPSEINVKEQSEKTGPISPVTMSDSQSISSSVPSSIDSSVLRSTNNSDETMTTVINSTSEFKVNEQRAIINVIPTEKLTEPTYESQSILSSAPKSTEIDILQLATTNIGPKTEDEVVEASVTIRQASTLKSEPQLRRLGCNVSIANSVPNVVTMSHEPIPTLPTTYASQSIQSWYQRSLNILQPPMTYTMATSQSQIRSSQQPGHNNSISTDVKPPNDPFPKVTFRYRSPSMNAYRGTDRHPLHYRPYGTQLSYNDVYQRFTSLYEPNHFISSENDRTEFSLNISDSTRNNSMDVANETPPDEP